MWVVSPAKEILYYSVFELNDFNLCAQRSKIDQTDVNTCHGLLLKIILQRLLLKKVYIKLNSESEYRYCGSKLLLFLLEINFSKTNVCSVTTEGISACKYFTKHNDKELCHVNFVPLKVFSCLMKMFT